jgi:AcrR family transcriptional regulator
MAMIRPDARNRLIQAAQEELILGRGQLEMQAVAKRAQLSVGLAYHHLGSKAGLIAAVVEGFYRQLDAAAFDGFSLPSASWAERERARIAAYIRFHYSHPFAPLVIGALSRSPEVRDVEAAFMGQQLASGARMIATAQADGILSEHLDPHLTIALMSGGIRQAVLVALQRRPRPDPEALTDSIWAFMASALRLDQAQDNHFTPASSN